MPQSFSSGIIRLLQKNLKKEYTRTFTYRAFEDGVIEGHIGVALDLDRDDENLSSLILNMRAELKNREEERDE